MRKTRQEYFDIVVAHLRKQGRPAMNKQRECVYINEAGDRCGIGCLMREDQAAFWERHFGNLSLMANTKALYDVFGYTSKADFRFLEGLQKIHDLSSMWVSHVLGVFGWVFDKRLEDHMKVFADTYALQYTPPPGYISPRGSWKKYTEARKDSAQAKRNGNAQDKTRVL